VGAGSNFGWSRGEGGERASISGWVILFQPFILMPGAGQPQSKNWCFTLNNYTDVEYNSITTAAAGGKIQYIICGRECGESGTPHLQGYLQLSDRLRLNGVKKLLGVQRLHLEVARGSAEDSKKYCSKEDLTPFEFGNSVSQGSRTDIESFQAAVIAGVPTADLVQSHFGFVLRYHRGLGVIRGYLAKPRAWRTQCVYVYGRTGTGKTRFVHEDSQNLCPGSVTWLPDNSLKWFDGYETGTKGVILDDFDGTASIATLLRVIDRYPLKVPIKGGFVEFNPRIIWITSNYSPAHWYHTQGEHYNALMRRIDEIKELN